MDAFRNKGNMSAYVAGVPVRVVMNPKVGLIGGGGGGKPPISAYACSSRVQPYQPNDLITLFLFPGAATGRGLPKS